MKKLFDMLPKHKDERGFLALFADPHDLLCAIRKLRSQGLTKLEAFTPFPVHGIEEALGLARSWIPWATLAFGLTGAGLLFLFQYWTHAVDWPVNIGGKPYFSWPAYIPITFEGGILFGGVLTVLTLFATLGLPNRNQAALDGRITTDMFGLFIEADDPKYNEVQLKNALQDCGLVESKRIEGSKPW